MEDIKIKVYVSKDAAIAQGATAWGESILFLTPEIAARVQAANDPVLARCFMEDTHEVDTPTLEAALCAADRATQKRASVVRELLTVAKQAQITNLNRFAFPYDITVGRRRPPHYGLGYNSYDVGKYGTPEQIAELAALEKIYNDAKTARDMERYRESAVRYLAGEWKGVVRAPSLIGIDPALDAKVAAHTQTLLETSARLDVLRETAIRDINRAILLYENNDDSMLLKQFDANELRDSEILETIAGWARLWIVRGIGREPDGTMLTRIRADELERIRPTPAEFVMLRAIEHVANDDYPTRAVLQRLVQSPLVSGTVKVSARLCTWSDWASGEEDVEGNPKSHRVIEVAFTVETFTQDIPSAKGLIATQRWTVYFRLPSA